MRWASVPHGSSYKVLVGLGRTSHGDTSKSQSTGEGVNLKEGDEPGGPRSGRQQRLCRGRERAWPGLGAPAPLQASCH